MAPKKSAAKKASPKKAAPGVSAIASPKSASTRIRQLKKEIDSLSKAADVMLARVS